MMISKNNTSTKTPNLIIIDISPIIQILDEFGTRYPNIEQDDYFNIIAEIVMDISNNPLVKRANVSIDILRSAGFRHRVPKFIDSSQKMFDSIKSGLVTLYQDHNLPIWQDNKRPYYLTELKGNTMTIKYLPY